MKKTIKVLTSLFLTLILLLATACGNGDSGLKRIKVSGEKISKERAIEVAETWNENTLNSSQEGWYSFEMYLKTEIERFATANASAVEEGDVIASVKTNFTVKGLVFVGEKDYKLRLTLDGTMKTISMNLSGEKSKHEENVSVEMTFIDGKAYVMLKEESVDNGDKEKREEYLIEDVQNILDEIEIGEIPDFLEMINELKGEYAIYQDDNTLFVKEITMTSGLNIQTETVSAFTADENGILQKVSVYLEQVDETYQSQESAQKVRVNLTREESGEINLPEDIEKYEPSQRVAYN